MSAEIRLAPAAIERLIGISPDSLRDWRRRNVFDDIGTRDISGRWIFSALDALKLGVAKALADRGIDLETAHSAANDPLIRRAFIENVKSGEDRAFALRRCPTAPFTVEYSFASSFEALGKMLDSKPDMRREIFFSARQVAADFSPELRKLISEANL